MAVVDSGNSIEVFNSELQSIGMIPYNAVHLSGAYACNGMLFVCNETTKSIDPFQADHTMLRSIDEFKFPPTGITAASTGHTISLLVCHGNIVSTVMLSTNSGVCIAKVDILELDKGVNLHDIAVANNHIILLDKNNSCIYKCELGSQEFKKINIQCNNDGGANDILSAPQGLCVESTTEESSNVIVADTGNDRLVRVNIPSEADVLTAHANRNHMIELNDRSPIKVATFDGRIYFTSKQSKTTPPLNDALDVSFAVDLTDMELKELNKYLDSPHSHAYNHVTFPLVAEKAISAEIASHFTSSISRKAKSLLQMMYARIRDPSYIPTWNSIERENITKLLHKYRHRDEDDEFIPYHNDIACLMTYYGDDDEFECEMKIGSIVDVNMDDLSFQMTRVNGDSIVGVKSWKPSITLNQQHSSNDDDLHSCDDDENMECIAIYGSVFVLVESIDIDVIDTMGMIVVIDVDEHDHHIVSPHGIGRIISLNEFIKNIHSTHHDDDNNGIYQRIVGFCHVQDTHDDGGNDVDDVACSDGKLMVYSKKEDLPSEIAHSWSDGDCYCVVDLLPMHEVDIKWILKRIMKDYSEIPASSRKDFIEGIATYLRSPLDWDEM